MEELLRLYTILGGKIHYFPLSPIAPAQSSRPHSDGPHDWNHGPHHRAIPEIGKSIDLLTEFKHIVRGLRSAPPETVPLPGNNTFSGVATRDFDCQRDAKHVTRLGMSFFPERCPA